MAKKPEETAVAGTIEKTGVAGPLDTAGFVTDLQSKEGGNENWGKLSIDRRMYKPDYCAKYGGVQGYLLDVEEMQSDIAKNPKNPDGIFQALIVRLTMPCPIVDDKEVMSRAEPGEDVIVVVTDRLKRLVELNADPENCAELRIIPLAKEKIGGGKQLWRYDVEARLNKIPRKSVSADQLMFTKAPEKLLSGPSSAPAAEGAAKQPATA